MSEFQAGVGRANITPAVGIPLAGFFGRGPAVGVHDDLLATALALEQDGERTLVIAMDVLGVQDRVTAAIRAEITRATGVPENHILLCASHTHYGAKGLYMDEEPGSAFNSESGHNQKMVDAYCASLIYLVAGSAITALGSLQPAQLSFGKGHCSININRRRRRVEDPCDKDVLVTRIDTANGEPLAALVNYACHPVIGAENREQLRDISADFIWSMRQVMERETGATCLFLQGACGDLNPIEMRNSFEPVRRQGMILGCEAVKAYETATPAAEGPLAIVWEKIGLPAKSYRTAREGQEQIAGWQAEYENLLKESDPNPAGVWCAEYKLARAKERLSAAELGSPLPTVAAELTALRIGGVAFVTCPGEIFTQIGMDVKVRSPIPQTCFVAYANGNIFYVPTPKTYPEGGYEVDVLCHVGPEAAPLIVEKSLALLGRLA